MLNLERELMQAMQYITDTGSLLSFLDAKIFPSEATKVLLAGLNHSKACDEVLSAYITFQNIFEQAPQEKSRFHRQNVSAHQLKT